MTHSKLSCCWQFANTTQKRHCLVAVLLQGAGQLVLLAQQHRVLLFLQVTGPLQALTDHSQLSSCFLPGSKLALQQIEPLSIT